MLTRQLKTVLNGIKQMTDNQDYPFSYSDTYADGENSLYCPDTNKTYDYTRYAGQIEATVEHLMLEGFLTVDSGHRIPQYRLTYKGMHYGQLNAYSAADFTLRNIVVPIIVAAITAFLTSWVTIQLRSPKEVNYSQSYNDAGDYTHSDYEGHS